MINYANYETYAPIHAIAKYKKYVDFYTRNVFKKGFVIRAALHMCSTARIGFGVIIYSNCIVPRKYLSEMDSKPK